MVRQYVDAAYAPRMGLAAQPESGSRVVTAEAPAD
jgi:hypothetical protein